MDRHSRFSWVIATALVFIVGLPCAQGQTPRILVVGDSWTPAMLSRIQIVLDDLGLSEYTVEGDLTSRPGSTAAQWATPTWLGYITAELTANPTIDIVHLSMGGNDYLYALPLTPEEIAALVEQVFDDIDTVVAHILSIRPAARVALCSYDYVADQGHNDALGLFAQTALARTATNPNYFYINNLGLMHYAYGYSGEFGPGETPFPGGYPDYDPLMGGDPSLPGPPEALADAIHLTGEAYLVLAERCVNEFYADWLMGLGDYDGDGLMDADETRDLDPLAAGTQNPFDPNDPDNTGDDFSTGADGTPDGSNDYDGDGMTNRDEFAFGYNPIDPGSWAELPLFGLVGRSFLALLMAAAASAVVGTHGESQRCGSGANARSELEQGSRATRSR